MEGPQYTLVDFSDCDARQVAEIYRALGAGLLEASFGSVLLKTAVNNVEGHQTLHDVLRTLLRVRSRPVALKLALLAGVPQLEAYFQRLQRDFRMTGFEVRIVQTENEARRWFMDGP